MTTRVRMSHKTLSYSLFLLLVFASGNLWAAGLAVTYTQGQVAVRTAGNWKEVSLGETLSTEGVVRLGGGSYLELRGPSQGTLTFVEPGTYSLSDILSESGYLKAAGAGDAIQTALSALFSNESSNSTSAAGVRGAEESSSSATGWVSSNAQVYIDAGRTFMQSGRYRKAAEQFKVALATADTAKLPRIRYELSAAYELSGNTLAAAKQIETANAPSSAVWFPNYALLKGRILVETHAYRDSLDWLTSHKKAVLSDPRRSSLYHLLVGVAYEGLGDPTAAKRNLSLVTSSPGNLSSLARTMLSNKNRKER